MSQAIIIADASTTIQKVIKISLAEGPYSIDSCADIDQLKKAVAGSHKILVILDFDFDDSRDCLSVMTELKSINSELDFIVLYIDRDKEEVERLKSLNACEALAKPFETDDLIHLCQKFNKFNNDFSAEEDTDSHQTDWKISVPGVIGEEDPGQVFIPEKIEGGETLIDDPTKAGLEEDTEPGFSFSRRQTN